MLLLLYLYLMKGKDFYIGPKFLKFLNCSYDATTLSNHLLYLHSLRRESCPIVATSPLTLRTCVQLAQAWMELHH